MKILLLTLVLSLAIALPAAADDEGHHHEDMNEVQVGTVHFPSSCSASVQKPVERGVAMLHSFWFSEGEKGYTDEQRVAIAARYVIGIQELLGRRFEPDMRTRDERVVSGLQKIVDNLVTRQPKHMVELGGRRLT